MNSSHYQNIEENYKEWMYKTLETEKQDWQKGSGPDADDQGYYHTVAPVIIFQMIEQNLQVASTIGYFSVFQIICEEFHVYLILLAKI
jgi:exocyst complex component 3